MPTFWPTLALDGGEELHAADAVDAMNSVTASRTGVQQDEVFMGTWLARGFRADRPVDPLHADRLLSGCRHSWRGWSQKKLGEYLE
jgi:hypothetical protein